MSNIIPPNLSHPGALVREEVEGRGWSLSDLAKIMGRPLQAVSEIVNGKKSITASTAKELGEALGTGAEFWIKLQAMWDLSHAAEPSSAIRERAAIYEFAPVREMQRRGWIKKTSGPDELSMELARHFNVDSLQDVPKWLAATRASVSGERSALTPEQWAWCCRARHVATLVVAQKYSASALRECIPELRALAANPEEIRRVPRLLAEVGIRFVVVEHLQHTKMDGAALTPNPIVAVSLRYGQIDKFWFTLMHEIAHILHGDGVSVDSELNLLGNQIDDSEARANETAASWLVPPDDLESFIRRTTGAYTSRKIENFASRIGVHPAIVAGQLKRRKEIEWSEFAKLHIDVRGTVRQSSVSDGWGEPAPLGD